jgi:uncharacterized protein
MKSPIHSHRRHFRHDRSAWGRLAFAYRRLRRSGRYWYCRLTRMSDSPERLARGLAVGIFAGFFPFVGTQSLFAIALALPFRANKLAAVLGTWVSNPLTSLPLYLFNFKIGCALLGLSADFSSDGLSLTETLLALREEFLSALFLGCFVSGLVASPIGYWIALRLIRSWRRTHHRTRSNSPSSDRPLSKKFDPREIVPGRQQ